MFKALNRPLFLDSYFKFNKGISFPVLKDLMVPRLSSDALKNPKLPFPSPKKHLIVASLVINLLSMALPILTLQVYDRLLVSQNLGTLKVLAIGIVVVVVLDMILRLCRSYITAWSGAAYEHVVSCNAMRHVLASDLVSLHKDGVGKHLQRMAGIAKMREFMSGSALVTIIDLPFVFIFLGLIIWLAGWLVMVPITLLVVFASISIWLGICLKASLQVREESDQKRLDFIIESLEGIHSLKSMALEPFFQRRYEHVQKNTSAANLNLGRLNAEAVMLGTLFSQIMMVLMIAFGAPMALSGTITMGTLIACVLVSARITQPIQRAFGLWARYQDFMIAQKDVKDIFAFSVLDRVDSDQLEENQGRLTIKSLDFSYGRENILSDINLDLKRGQAICVSGPRGAGKTTLLKLMAGLYQPQSGSVFINDVPATKYPARDLVKHIGFLPMDGMIFRGTIWDNLSSFGEYEAEQVEELVSLLDLDMVIKQLPAGYDTKLEGVQSDPLPPGLRQRLAIARALVPKPRIVLFDNADRGLDREGYNTVYRLLARLKKKATLIIVSDDSNISRLADEEYTIVAETLIRNQDDTNVTDILPYRELRL